MARNLTGFPQHGPAFEAKARRIVESLLAQWFGGQIAVKLAPREPMDFVAKVSGHTLAMEFKAEATASAVHRAIEQLGHRTSKSSVPVVVVPFMGEAGRQICARANVSWIDLSGNADVRAPGLRIFVDGRPNQFVRAGRPSTPFAPKSSRVARWLLLHPTTSASQRELAKATRLDPGQVSRIVARLKDQGLVKVGVRGRVQLGDRGLMLGSWSVDYRFQRHLIVRGHVPARTGTEVVEKLGQSLRDARVEHAFTGLSGAWPYTRAAGFRLVTAFVQEHPPASVLRAADFVEQERGSNAWIVVPNDLGVFDGSRSIDGVSCAHPVQVWLDLKEQPERAAEVAHDLFDRILHGEFDG